MVRSLAGGPSSRRGARAHLVAQRLAAAPLEQDLLDAAGAGHTEALRPLQPGPGLAFPPVERWQACCGCLPAAISPCGSGAGKVIPAPPERMPPPAVLTQGRCWQHTGSAVPMSTAWPHIPATHPPLMVCGRTIHTPTALQVPFIPHPGSWGHLGILRQKTLAHMALGPCLLPGTPFPVPSSHPSLLLSPPLNGGASFPDGSFLARRDDFLFWASRTVPNGLDQVVWGEWGQVLGRSPSLESSRDWLLSSLSHKAWATRCTQQTSIPCLGHTLHTAGINTMLGSHSAHSRHQYHALTRGLAEHAKVGWSPRISQDPRSLKT